MAGSAAGLYLAGRLLGTVELAMLAAGALAALVTAGILVAIPRPHVTSGRVLHPPRLHAGTPAHAELRVANRGTGPTPVLRVTDRVAAESAGPHEAQFAVAPLPPGEEARAAYRLPTTRRGVYELGPLLVSVTDPLGLLRRSLVVDPPTDVTVYPRVVRIAPLALTAGRDLVGGVVEGYGPARAGEEFHALREYTDGDDLRRVHWKSSARTGHLMIKDMELPWQVRATVLLDTRSGVHTPETFEGAVEAAASLATALHHRRALLRLLTTGGLDHAHGSGHEHYQAVMERLAVVSPSRDDRFDAVATRLHQQAGAGALVAVTGSPHPGDLEALAMLRRRFRPVIAITLGRPSTVPHTRTPHMLVVDASDRSLAEAWGQATRRLRPTLATVRGGS